MKKTFLSVLFLLCFLVSGFADTEDMIYSIIEDIYASPEKITKDLFLKNGFIPFKSHYKENEIDYTSFISQFKDSSLVVHIYGNNSIHFSFHSTSEKDFLSTWNAVFSHFNKKYSLTLSFVYPKDDGYFDSSEFYSCHIFYTASNTKSFFCLDVPAYIKKDTYYFVISIDELT